MTRLRVYFTETIDGCILCDSEDEAQEIRQAIENGEPIDEVAPSENIVTIDHEVTTPTN